MQTRTNLHERTQTLNKDRFLSDFHQYCDENNYQDLETRAKGKIFKSVKTRTASILIGLKAFNLVS